MLQRLAQIGICGHMLRAIACMYSSVPLCARVDGELSEYFDSNTVTPVVSSKVIHFLHYYLACSLMVLSSISGQMLLGLECVLVESCVRCCFMQMTLC